MTKKLAFQIFLWGTLSSAVLFLWLTWDTHRQVVTLSHVDNLSEEVVAGKRVFEKYNCNDCHTIIGFGGYYAPDLTRVVQRVGAQQVRTILKDPAKAFAHAKRKMPQQNLKEAEIDNLVAFLTWVGKIDNNDWPPQDSKKNLSRNERRLTAGAGLSPGAAVFKTVCIKCHALGGVGGDFGPALDTVGEDRSEKEIMQYVHDPKSVDPDSEMPAQSQLTDRELEEVARFLANLKNRGE